MLESESLKVESPRVGDLSSFGPTLFEIWWPNIYLGGPYGPVKDKMYWPGGLKSAPGQRASAYVEGCVRAHVCVMCLRYLFT